MNTFRKAKSFIALVSLLSLGIAQAQPIVSAKAGDLRSENESKKNVPVVVYAEKVSEVFTQNRYWPTFQILKKVDDKQPEVLLDSIGKVGEYPSNFKLSPDNKTLVIDLEDKLVALDLKTKTFTDIPVGQKQEVRNLIFSPDSKNLLIWEQGDYGQNAVIKYTVSEYSFADKTTKNITNGQANPPSEIGAFGFEKWRNDGVLLLTLGWEGPVSFWTFNLNTKELKQVPNESGGLGPDTSKTGKYFVAAKQMMNDSCPSAYGDTPSTYALIDALTGVEKRSFGEEGKQIDVVAFSADDSEVVYATYTVKPNECDANPQKSYFVMNIANGHVKSVADYKEYLKEWHELLTTFEQGPNNKTVTTIWYGENPVLKTEDGQVIATYVQK